MFHLHFLGFMHWVPSMSGLFKYFTPLFLFPQASVFLEFSFEFSKTVIYLLGWQAL
jgi:hypothetical protein